MGKYKLIIRLKNNVSRRSYVVDRMFIGTCPTGTDGVEMDCNMLIDGTYQHCYSCKKYFKCFVGVATLFFIGPDKYYDTTAQGAAWWSYSCKSNPNGGDWPAGSTLDGGIISNTGSSSNDWRDITCITFDQTPDPFQGTKGIYVKHTGVTISSSAACASPPGAGQCGYFPSGRALLEIPYFKWNDFHKFTLSFWFRRSLAQIVGKQALINKGSCVFSGFDVSSTNIFQVEVETTDESGTMMIKLLGVSCIRCKS